MEVSRNQQNDNPSYDLTDGFRYTRRKSGKK